MQKIGLNKASLNFTQENQLYDRFQKHKGSILKELPSFLVHQNVFSYSKKLAVKLGSRHLTEFLYGPELGEVFNAYLLSKYPYLENLVPVWKMEYGTVFIDLVLHGETLHYKNEPGKAKTVSIISANLLCRYLKLIQRVLIREKIPIALHAKVQNYKEITAGYFTYTFTVFFSGAEIKQNSSDTEQLPRTGKSINTIDILKEALTLKKISSSISISEQELNLELLEIGGINNVVPSISSFTSVAIVNVINNKSAEFKASADSITETINSPALGLLYLDELARIMESFTRVIHLETIDPFYIIREDTAGI